MNKITEYIKSVFQQTASKEAGVVSLSDNIKNMIGAHAYPKDFRYTFGCWKIVLQHRCFSKEWQCVLEAIPLECGDNLGYSNSENPSWVDPKGTATAVLMPDRMVKKFLSDLAAHLNLQ